MNPLESARSKTAAQPSEHEVWDRTTRLLREKRRGPGTAPSECSQCDISQDGTAHVEFTRVLIIAVHVKSPSLPTYLKTHFLWHDACMVLRTQDGRPSIELVPTEALLSGHFAF
jgi:hypothetical protein